MGEERSKVTTSITYDPETETYRATFDNAEQAPSMAVVGVLASICEVEPTDLEPIQKVIDPDALASLLVPRTPEQRKRDLSVSFVYHDLDVTIRSYGLVKIAPRTTGK